jgi:hypothetical protein
LIENDRKLFLKEYNHGGYIIYSREKSTYSIN